MVIHYLHIFHLMSQKKHDYYRGKDCMKIFLKNIKKHATEITNHKKGNDTIQVGYIYKKKFFVYIKKEFSANDENKLYHKV